MVLLVCLNGTIQQQQQMQYWRNNPNLVKQVTNNNIGNGFGSNNNMIMNAPQQQQQYNQIMNNNDNFAPSSQSPILTAANNPTVEQSAHQQQQQVVERKTESKNYIYANGAYPILVNNAQPLVQLQQPNTIVVAPGPVVSSAIQPVPVGAFPIQQPVVSTQGEIIIENTIGGIPFDCRGRPTGHWRDTRFCDIFHACVHGYQRKTYACPIVGERTYFDEVTKRCEFVSRNPLVCSVFLK